MLKIKRFIRRVAPPGYWNHDYGIYDLPCNTNWITIFTISRIWISLNKRSHKLSRWVFALVYNTPWKFSGEISYYIQKHFSLIVNYDDIKSASFSTTRRMILTNLIRIERMKFHITGNMIFILIFMSREITTLQTRRLWFWLTRNWWRVSRCFLFLLQWMPGNFEMTFTQLKSNLFISESTTLSAFQSIRPTCTIYVNSEV